MSNLPALAEIVEDGVTGILYPPGNLSKLAESISIVLNDREFGEKLGNLYEGEV